MVKVVRIINQISRLMKGIATFSVTSALFVVFTIACSRPENESRFGTQSRETFTPADTSWKSLTLREKIGQTMIMVAGYYEHINFEGGTLDTFFSRYPVGGFYLADWYYNYHAPKDSSVVYYIKESVKNYQACSKYPLIFMEDYERGLGALFPDYTHLPVEMAVGAADSEQLAYDFEKSIALEARDLGINWLLHPVSDLNMNPLNSLINERAVSDDPERAIPLLEKQIEAMHSLGVISTIKHFPGDGTTIRDQHLITASNTLDWKTWKKTFGRVFQSLINHGAASVMVGHITFPAYQKEKRNGEYLPASLSKEIIQKLLKNEMHFNGVVISDALNMGGAVGYYSDELETSIECFKAGADMLLWPGLAFMDTLEARIGRKEIPMERLDDAVERIWGLKERFGLLRKDHPLFTPLTNSDRTFIERTAKSIAENAVTLVRGSSEFLPVDTATSCKILLVNVSEIDKSALFRHTKELLENRGFIVNLRYGLSYFDWNWRWDSLAYYDRIFACLENKYFDPVGLPFFKGIEAESVWSFNMLPEEKVIVVSYSNPYYVNFYFPHVPVLINAYGSDRFMQEAVIKALAGEIEFRGTSPVKLEHDILK